MASDPVATQLGLLRKSRRFALELRGDMPLELRAIVLRYDALLNLVASPSD